MLYLMGERIKLQPPFSGWGETNETRSHINLTPGAFNVIAYCHYLECVRLGRRISLAEYDSILKNKELARLRMYEDSLKFPIPVFFDIDETKLKARLIKTASDTVLSFINEGCDELLIRRIWDRVNREMVKVV